jgi:hypothetical protein
MAALPCICAFLSNATPQEFFLLQDHGTLFSRWLEQ